MKLLFLDDAEERTKIAKKYFAGKHSCDYAETAAEAIKFLKRNDYDIVMLDHDLGLTQYSASDEFSGFEVARFICDMKQKGRKVPRLIVIHSWNPVGALYMQNQFYAYDIKHSRVLFSEKLIIDISKIGEKK